MSNILLVDFGASRVKCVIWSSAQQKVIDEIVVASPTPKFGILGEVEVTPEDYWRALEITAGILVNKYSDLDKMWLCTEMHGLILADPSGLLLTPYISWRDSRAVLKNDFGISTFDKLSLQGDEFFNKTGMNLRVGFPIVSLAHIVSQIKLPSIFRVFTLADWLIWRGGDSSPAIHRSLAAGTGLYDIHKEEWSSALLDIAGVNDSRVIFPSLVAAGASIGKINLSGKTINVYGAIGDLQSAVYGAGFPNKVNLLINLGTGSQIVRRWHNIPLGIERRPSVDDLDFAAITHIPSGRALNVFANFLNSCSSLGNGEPFFWQKFDELSVEEILKSSLEVDMNVFTAAWEYQYGGSIKYIHENNLTPNKLLAAIARSWLTQYIRGMEQLDPYSEDLVFYVSGGLSRRAKFAVDVLSALSGKSAELVVTITGEETLDGLLALARSCSHVD
jgi:sugar (pentulose or hexulose) kinase